MAISTRSLTVPTKEAADKSPCPCGCAPCEGTCCHLDCIVRPHFFCGQLLTDADLSALLKWARDRFGLSRYRHGWGVVCGLDVRCDPKLPASIIVTPGYAVNCCGDDIVVCETATLDLSAVCREEEDPCADLRRRYEAIAPGKVPGLRRGSEGAHLMGGDIIGSPDLPKVVPPRVVDIYLRYDEKPSEPTTALGRGSCKQVSECEYSRTRESYKLTYKSGVQGDDPVQARAVRWHEGYEKCLDVLKEFRAQFTHGLTAAVVRRWLVRWIDAHPQSRPCGMREEVCGASDGDLSDERNLVRLLFELVLACRTSYLNCDCFGCDDDAGVPLARVWLTMGKDGGNEGCRIRAIDPYPPYRRPIQPECWPAPLGYVNVGRFIWHRWEEACTALHDLGLHVTRKDFTLPATLAALERALECDLFVPCGEERDALVYATEFLDDRVVGFCKTTDIPHPVAPDMTFTKIGSLAGGRPGQSVAYVFEVHNTGNVALQVRVEDAGLNLVRDLGTIAPGGSQHFESPGTIPANASGSFSNTATATGTGSGQTITRNATANITILAPDCPTINVRCPNNITAGHDITFSAFTSGGDPLVSPTFFWEVSAGAIRGDPHRPSIQVDTSGLSELLSVTAKVTVGGYDPSCHNDTASGTTNILAQDSQPSKFDEFGDLRREEGDLPDMEEDVHLDKFARQLRNEPSTQGYIIVYGARSGATGEARERAANAKDYIVNGRDVDASRIVTMDGGLREELWFELWIVPAGAAPPTPTPTMSISTMSTPTLSAQLSDKLTEINQIGPARAAKLNEAGISTFAGLASTTVERLKELVPEVGEDVLRGWIESAKSRTT